jgi:phospholipid N-methyltransferase
MELYEAVFFFNKIYCFADNELPQQINAEKAIQHGLSESAYKAIIRILVVTNLIDCRNNYFEFTYENKEKHRDILNIIANKNQDGHFTKMFAKASNECQFFFNSINELEYEIYSRCNFPVTYETGNEVIKHIDLTGKNVLELGGNSGGFGTALSMKYKDCRYAVVDTKIPCMVGNEFKEANKSHITFIEGSVFELTLPDQIYDYIVIMNLLHNFDDDKCIEIMRNCIKHCDNNTKFMIIEDILVTDFEPKEVIMHGLRLSVECRGGKQRTIEELVDLFLSTGYGLKKSVRLCSVHSMLVFGSCIE